MTDLDLNISTEDGQLLSKLVNELAQCQFEIDHYMELNVMFVIGLCFLMLLIAIALGVMVSDSHDVLSGVLLAAFVFVIGSFIIYGAVSTLGPISLEKTAVGLEAQIEVLLNRYGLTWADLPSLGVNI